MTSCSLTANYWKCLRSLEQGALGHGSCRRLRSDQVHDGPTRTRGQDPAASRPELVEREATHRAISHTELIVIPIVIVHVSGRETMEQIQWARGCGLKVYAETCPQYLVMR